MRKLIGMGAGVLVVLALGGAARADGPSGSHEEENVVLCNRALGPTAQGVNVGHDQLGNWVYVGANGVETCSDDDIPLDGRIIVSREDPSGGYVSADGTETNRPLGLSGYLRYNFDGKSCTSPNAPSRGDSTNPEQCR